MPKDYEWRHWAKHKDVYGTLSPFPHVAHAYNAIIGPVSSVCVMGQPIIILNSLKACEDLLEKRSSIYSGRPVLQFAGEMYAVPQQHVPITSHLIVYVKGSVGICR